MKMQNQKVQSSFDLTISGSVIAQSTSSYMASRRVVHIMLRCSLINIMYRRLRLDERYFMTKYLDDVPFIKFRKTPHNVKDRLIVYYVRWLLAIKHAIDRKYLKEVFLYLKSPSGDILELYKFTLRYNSDGDKAYRSMIEPAEVTLKAKALMDVIRRLSHTEKLGDDTEPDLHITYNDEAPRDYLPPGFERDVEPLPSFDKTGLIPISYGSMNTGYHKLSCYGSVVISNQHDVSLSQSQGNREKEDPFDIDIEELRSAPNDDVDGENSRIDESEKSCVLTDGISPLDTLPTVQIDNSLGAKTTAEKDTSARAKKQKVLNSSAISIDGSIEEDIISLSSDGRYECVLCQMNVENIEVLTCTKCCKTQHSVCHGYWQVNEILRDTFVCNACGETDQKIKTFPVVLKNNVAKIRLLIYHAKKEGIFPDHILESFCPQDKKMFLALTSQYHLVKPDKSINTDGLDVFLGAMFNDCNNSQFFE